MFTTITNNHKSNSLHDQIILDKYYDYLHSNYYNQSKAKLMENEYKNDPVIHDEFMKIKYEYLRDKKRKGTYNYADNCEMRKIELEAGTKTPEQVKREEDIEKKGFLFGIGFLVLLSIGAVLSSDN